LTFTFWCIFLVGVYTFMGYFFGIWWKQQKKKKQKKKETRKEEGPLFAKSSSQNKRNRMEN
jgi:predicted membrane protein